MRPFPIEPRLRDYAWGTHDFIPRALGLPSSNSPVAEAWFGAHPSAPSLARVDGQEVTLDTLLAERSLAILGERVQTAFGRLPCLLKLLSAARPLSIQVHPTKAQAEEGWRRQSQNPDGAKSYVDDNHKPELLVALTPFFGLCGFRDPATIAQHLEELPELGASLPFDRSTALRDWVAGYFALPPAIRTPALLAWVRRLEARSPSSEDWRHWVVEAHRLFSPEGGADPGLVFFALLHFVRLEPGQALFLQAGVPHAYLRGSGLEVMANSDNVLRGGLTPKAVDVPELLKVTRFESAPPFTLEGELQSERGSRERRYPTPASEFELSRIDVDARATAARTADGPEILFVESGTVSIEVAAERLTLFGGKSCMIPHGTHYVMRTPDGARITRIVVPRAATVGAFSEAEQRRLRAIRANIAHTELLLRDRAGAALIGCVSGSESAQRFWQRRFDEARRRSGAERVIALHEDLPVNQAFGVLLAWQRLRPHIVPGKGALVSFVFGEGTRATPFTETDNGQKPAMLSFVRTGEADARYVPMAELALRHFAPVEAHLRRSGFEGLVVKWGDEVQIPSQPLDGKNPLFDRADVVRFVSLRVIDDDDARNKDWVGVDAQGRVTSFIPRRPLAEMQRLADQGVLRREGEHLLGGVNLGSIALSFRLLDALLEEFETDVGDPTKQRRDRPDLDPQFFSALTVACITDDAAREEAWKRAQSDSPSLVELSTKMPDLLSRLRRVTSGFERKYGRAPRLVAMDFGEPYWGDIGQHRQIREFYQALRERTPNGVISRALAGIGEERDENGNILVNSRLPASARVRDSVLIDCEVHGECDVESSVLIGTRCKNLRSSNAFDVDSCVHSLQLADNAGGYRIVDPGRIVVPEGKRMTSLFAGGFSATEPVHLVVGEDTDLRKRALTYDVPVEGNAISFAGAHDAAVALDPGELRARREAALARVRESFE